MTILAVAGHVSRMFLHCSKIRTDARKIPMDGLVSVNENAYQVSGGNEAGIAKLSLADHAGFILFRLAGSTSILQISSAPR